MGTPHAYSWIGAIIAGALAGLVAKQIMGDRAGLIITVILGIIGGFVGDFIVNQVLHLGFGASWIGSLVVAIIGACIVLAIYNAVAGRRTV